MKDVVEEAAKDVGAPVKVAGFVRLALGEGIERGRRSDSPPKSPPAALPQLRLTAA